MKAAPLLRAWLHRLRESGVKICVRHRWLGWTDEGNLRFATPEGEQQIAADAVILACGGGSWPQLGSDGAWQSVLQAQGISVKPLQAANCGFDSQWSSSFSQEFAGQPIKSAVLAFTDAQGNAYRKQGDYKHALDCYMEAIALDPDSPAVVAKEMLDNIFGFYCKDYYNP